MRRVLISQASADGNRYLELLNVHETNLGIPLTKPLPVPSNKTDFSTMPQPSPAFPPSSLQAHTSPTSLANQKSPKTTPFENIQGSQPEKVPQKVESEAVKEPPPPLTGNPFDSDPVAQPTVSRAMGDSNSAAGSMSHRISLDEEANSTNPFGGDSEDSASESDNAGNPFDAPCAVSSPNSNPFDSPERDTPALLSKPRNANNPFEHSSALIEAAGARTPDSSNPFDM